MANFKAIKQIKSSMMQMEAASELGATYSDYHGDLTAKQCGSLGGEMMKKKTKHTKD